MLAFAQVSIAKEIAVKISPIKEIKTSTPELQEGDTIYFEVVDDVFVNSKLYIKAGEQVTGIVTTLEENGFVCKEAVVYAEDFKTKNINHKTEHLKGLIYRHGNTHWMFGQFFNEPDNNLIKVFRGGEVFIKPEETFTMYLEAKND